MTHPRTCEAFELDLVMREHGALVPAATAALDDHLATCAACSQFAATGSDVETALRHIAERDAASVDWGSIEAGIRSLRRGQRLKMWLAPLFLLQVPLCLLVATGKLAPGEPLLFVGPPLTVALYLAWVWVMGRPFREVLAVVTARDELVIAYQRELRRQRTRARLFAAMSVTFALAAAVVAVVDRDQRLAGLFVAVVFAGWAALDLGVRLPRLARALADVQS